MDVYDASQTSAAGLGAYVFNASSATAGPWLGNALSAATLQAASSLGWQDSVTVDLSPYAGKSVYVVPRLVPLTYYYTFGAPWLLASLHARSARAVTPRAPLRAGVDNVGTVTC